MPALAINPTLLLAVMSAHAAFRARVEQHFGANNKYLMNCAGGHLWIVAIDDSEQILGHIKIAEPHINTPSSFFKELDVIGGHGEVPIDRETWVAGMASIGMPNAGQVLDPSHEEPMDLYPRLGPVYAVIRENRAEEALREAFGACSGQPAPQKPTWSVSGNFFNLDFGTTNIEVLPQGIYNIRASRQGPFLERRNAGFDLPPKVYGMEQEFIARVVKTHAHTTNNLGILLNGIRGTGKTVTAELLAMELGRPIILVTEDIPGLVDFMDSIPHEVTFLCDEFEKVFSGSTNDMTGRASQTAAQKLLPIMDGVMSNQHRKVFILTTNQLSVEQNLLQRPGRVRYLKTFGNLPRPAIEMIVDDLLLDKESKAKVVNFIAQLELITVDIVTALIEELNIHSGDPAILQEFFNVKKRETRFDVTLINEETGEDEKTRYSQSIVPWEPVVGEDLHINGDTIGQVLRVEGSRVRVNREIYVSDGPNTFKEVTIRIEPRANYNEDSFGRNFKGF